MPKAAELLRPGGAAARFWNQYSLDPDVTKAFDAVYRRHAPEIPAARERRPSTAFEESRDFAPVLTHVYKSSEIRTVDEWVATVATTSDHLRLGPERLSPLLAELREAVERLGGALRAHRTTFLALSRRL